MNKQTYLIGLTLLVIVAISLTVWYMRRNNDEKFEQNEDTEVLPPLNYFSSFEPPYFFYDPEISGAKSVQIKDEKIDDDAATSVDDIFGPANYIRYYGPDNVFYPDLRLHDE